MRDFVKAVITEYLDDEVPRRAAALAFYTTLSLAPLLIITIAFASFAGVSIQDRLVSEFTALVGERGGDLARTVLQHTSFQAGVIATAASIIMLLVGASGVFHELRSTLNEMWDINPARTGIKGFLLERLFSFALVLAVGFLLLVSLLASALLAAMGDLLASILPPVLLFTIESLLSVAVITLLFALLFRYVPQAHVGWRHTFLGGLVSAMLFVIGKLLIGIYLGRASIINAYGAAGSLLVILLWVYYTSQIFFLGAEVAQVSDRKKEGIGKEERREQEEKGEGIGEEAPGKSASS